MGKKKKTTKKNQTTTLQFNNESVLFVGRNNNLQVVGVVFLIARWK